MPVPADAQLSFRNFTVCIEVGGKPLTVYAPEYDDETRTATGWIASEPGKEYSVSWRRLKDVKSDVASDIFLDGQKGQSTCSGGLVFRDREISRWATTRGVRVAPKVLRPFVFAKLKTTDDPRYLSKSSPQPGTIMIKMERGIAGGLVKSREDYSGSLKNISVHEKAKKLGCHVTKLGDKRAVLRENVYDWSPSPYRDGESYVTFIFQYRAADVLQAMGVMPRPSGAKRRRDDSEEVDNDDEPDKAEDDDSDVEQDEAEIAALQAALQARMNALAAKKKVKREDVEADLTFKRRKVKQEEAMHVEFFCNPGEVIDLTSDP